VAEQALKAKADFLSIMSHEIRTPLNSVIGGAQLLMMNEFDEEYRSQIEMIHHSGVHLLNLINDVLDLSKMEAQKLELEEIPFDLTQLVEIVTKMNQNMVQEKGLYLDLQIDPSLPIHRKGDAARLRQVLLNLINNASKFTEKGGITLKISKSTRNNRMFVRFEVTDTGIGITAEQKQKLFNEYVQAESSINRKYGGTGLGLLICQKIVDSMEGSIGVNSDIGKGTTFWFEIPLEIEAEAAAQNALGEQVSQEGMKKAKHLSILVAEDNQTNQMLIQAILKKLGHTSVIAENGLEAVDALKGDQKFDLVLMDLNMPEMDGIEAAKVIRGLDGKPINLSDLGRVLDTWG
ncbi:MAG: response regulator, partial [Thiotrichales bacterium]|nr:response regulator [Thiotrichales bacterium]